MILADSITLSCVFLSVYFCVCISRTTKDKGFIYVTKEILGSLVLPFWLLMAVAFCVLNKNIAIYKE